MKLNWSVLNHTVVFDQNLLNLSECVFLNLETSVFVFITAEW